MFYPALDKGNPSVEFSSEKHIDNHLCVSYNRRIEIHQYDIARQPGIRRLIFLLTYILMYLNL